MILRLCVREHAYLPLSLPLRGCVFKDGIKGSVVKLLSTSLNDFSSDGFFFTSFPDNLRNEAVNSIFLCFIDDSFYCVIHGVESDLFFSLCLEYPFLKRFALLCFKRKIRNEILDLLQILFRKLQEKIINLFFFECIGSNMLIILISMKQSSSLRHWEQDQGNRDSDRF